MGVKFYKYRTEGDMEFKKQFVCRENEMQQLFDRLDWVMENKSPWITFIRGDYGNGKTTLLQHFSAAAKNVPSEMYIPFVSCYHNNDTSNSWPFAEVFTHLAEMDAGNKRILLDFLGLIGKNVPAWIDVFTGGVVRTTLETIKRTLTTPLTRRLITQDNLFQHYHDALQKMTKNHTIIIMIDDCQYADETTINLLNFLVLRLMNCAIYFIVTYRPYEIENSPENIFLKIRSNLENKYANEINLESGISAALYVQNQFLLPNRLIEEIQSYTGGHPENIEFLLSYWIEKEFLIANTQNKFVLAHPKGEDFPQFFEKRAGVRAERIKQMSPEMRTVLENAAVLGIVGDRFSLQCLKEMVGMMEEQVEEILSNLERKYSFITEEKTPGKLSYYRFLRHCIVEDTLNQMSEYKKRSLHQKAILVFGSYSSKDASHSSQMAIHYANCFDHFQASVFALQASSLEFSRFSYEETKRWCKFGLAEMDRHIEGKEITQCDISVIQLRQNLWQLSALSSFFNGDYDDAYHYFLMSAQDGMRFQLDPLRTASCLNFAAYTCYYLSRNSEVDNFVSMAREILIKIDQTTEVHIDNLIARSMTEYNQDHFEASNQFLNEALMKANELPSTEAIEALRADAYNFLGINYAILWEYEKAVMQYKSAVLIDQKYHNMRAKTMHTLNIADAYIEVGEIEKGQPFLEEGINLCRKMNDLDNLSYAFWIKATAYTKQGNYHLGLRTHFQSLKYASDCGAKWLLSNIYAGLAENFLFLNKLNEAKDHLAKAYSLNEDGELENYLIALNITAKLEEAQGNYREAEKAYMKLIETCLPARVCRAAGYQYEYADFLYRRNAYQQANQIIHAAIKTLERYNPHVPLEKAKNLLSFIREKYEED
jgi:tetratricopeptide (TPR) repeat protein